MSPGGQIPLFDRGVVPWKGEPEADGGRTRGRGGASGAARDDRRSRGSGPGTDGATGRPGESRETAVSVSALNARARLVLEGSFRPVWVAGEVANWRRVSSGHCYFTLRDEDAQVACVMFRSDARRLPASPEEGMEVVLRGEVTLYETRGRFQLVVRELEGRGDGLWRLAFERLKRKLGSEGLLDPERKRPLPRFPSRIGVVTSRDGAAVRDVVTGIRRRAPWTHVLLCSCRVQGDGATAEIVRALERLRERAVDLIIVARGGGSVEDLWCFNEEPVARAIVASPVPVVSAVGHEVDVTIADLVADARAPTPSAAAELAVPDRAELRVRVRRGREALVRGLRRRTRRGRERAERAEERLLAAASRWLERREGRVRRLGDRLHALSPLATLERGYAVPLGPDGRVLRRREMFEPGRAFRLRVVDGTVRCRTEGTEGLPERGSGSPGPQETP